MSILDKEIRVNHETERISVFNGAATLDFNGAEKERREAMRFYEKAPEMALLLRIIRDVLKDAGGSDPSVEYIDKVLRDAGVSDAPVSSERP